MTEATAPTRRELELEHDVWTARRQSCQNAAAALQAQTQLLQTQAAEVEQNIARLAALLKPVDVAAENTGQANEAKAA